MKRSQAAPSQAHSPHSNLIFLEKDIYGFMVDTCSFMAGTSDSLLQNKLLSAVMRTWPEV